MTRIAVLGCGPAGLLAVHAVKQHDPAADIRVLSKPQKSRIGGAMYLHRAIPELTQEEPEAFVHIEKKGDARGYAEKVYGDPSHPVSFTQFHEGSYPMWSLSTAYERLWSKYCDHIIPWTVRPDHIPELCREFDLVVSTVPKSLLCYGDHSWVSAPVKIVIHSRTVLRDTLMNVLVYSGRVEDTWHRYACIGGERSWEYGNVVPVQSLNGDMIIGMKPISNDCDCWSSYSGLIHAGRFGEWRKGVLTHHVFEQVGYAMLQL